jgi:hypothetical protein
LNPDDDRAGILETVSHALSAARLGKSLRRWKQDDFPYGAILGVVDVVGCEQAYDSPWAEVLCHHILLANPRKLERPIPAKGAVGLRYLKNKPPQAVPAVRRLVKK